MEYKKDIRTKNLTLHDIHVGDWVQVWIEMAERYTTPLKIISIHDDGTIYLVLSDEERLTPWEEDIKNVDALPITKELLQGFGFDVVQKSYPTDEYEVFYNGNKICEFWELCDCYLIETPWDSYEYFHEFMDGMCNEFPELLRLEWKGIEKTK